MASANESGKLDTAKVAGRRTLQFHSLDEIRAELDRLAGCECELLGNWTLGQIYWHLARGFDGAIDGMPREMAPWYLRLVGPLVKRRILNGRMGAGYKIPDNSKPALVGPPETTAEDGIAQMRAAIDRFESNATRQPHPVFGRLSTEEWLQLALRHCELHLSFVLPLNSGHHG